MRLDSNAPVSRVVQALTHKLTFTENIQASEVVVADTGTVDTEFTVQHTLGKTPRQYIYNINASGVVYDSRRSEWTQSQIYLKCSAANAELTLTIT